MREALAARHQSTWSSTGFGPSRSVLADPSPYAALLRPALVTTQSAERRQSAAALKRV